MKITKAGSKPTRQGNPDYFTGTVWQDPIADEPDRVHATNVTFTPGARTYWHTHPLGQTLVVIAGQGRVQAWGGPVQIIRKGDVVWIPPGEKHWHGASAENQMTHLAIHEQINGSAVNWLEAVSDADFAKAPEG